MVESVPVIVLPRNVCTWITLIFCPRQVNAKHRMNVCASYWDFRSMLFSSIIFQPIYKLHRSLPPGGVNTQEFSCCLHCSSSPHSCLYTSSPTCCRMYKIMAHVRSSIYFLVLKYWLLTVGERLSCVWCVNIAALKVCVSETAGVWFLTRSKKREAVRLCEMLNLFFCNTESLICSGFMLNEVIYRSS